MSPNSISISIGNSNSIESGPSRTTYQEKRRLRHFSTMFDLRDWLGKRSFVTGTNYSISCGTFCGGNW